METLGPICFVLLLIGALYGCSKAVIYAHRHLGGIFQSTSMMWLARLTLIVVACVVGVALSSLAWSWSDTQLIMGIPIPAAAWELRDGRWYDFVSPVSIVLLGLDFVIWVGILHFPIAFALYLKNRKGQMAESTERFRSDRKVRSKGRVSRRDRLSS